MGILFLAITAVETYLLGWLITGQSNPGEWELWFRTLFGIIWILWTMRAVSKYSAKKGKL